MKCLHCNFDSKRKERRNGRCLKCDKPFAFEPAGKDFMTDVGFQHCIDAVSNNGSVRWGVEHLYYEVCRRRDHWRLGCMGFVAALVMFALFAVSYFFTSNLMYAWIAAAILLSLLWLIKRNNGPLRSRSVSQKTFNHMWHRWQIAHGLPEGVIIRRSPQALAEQQQRQAEPDVADYSFDRVVVCDRARTVDLLLANNFHFEHNCAVLSYDGYPPHAFEIVRKMLKRNPRLEVYVLHDATYTGCTLARRLADDADWFQGFNIIDVGLKPRDAKKHPTLLIKPTRSSVQPDKTLSKNDAQWLSRHTLELAALRPQQIIQAVFNAMNSSFSDDDHNSSSGGSDGGDGEELDRQDDWFDGDSGNDSHDSFG